MIQKPHKNANVAAYKTKQLRNLTNFHLGLFHQNFYATIAQKADGIETKKG